MATQNPNHMATAPHGQLLGMCLRISLLSKTIFLDYFIGSHYNSKPSKYVFSEPLKFFHNQAGQRVDDFSYNLKYSLGKSKKRDLSNLYYLSALEAT